MSSTPRARRAAYRRTDRFSEELAAEGRLGERGYGHPYLSSPGWWVIARDVISKITVAMTLPGYTRHDGAPEVTGGDCLNALALIDSVRRSTDRDELALIEGALAAGATWEQIGDVLGFSPPESRAGCARRRLAKLRRDFPGFDKLEKPPTAL